MVQYKGVSTFYIGSTTRKVRVTLRTLLRSLNEPVFIDPMSVPVFLPWVGRVPDTSREDQYRPDRRGTCETQDEERAKVHSQRVTSYTQKYDIKTGVRMDYKKEFLFDTLRHTLR